ncbi:hypothetical protein EDD85DRAFT_790214 [Armillaria nabsnona]|nr:hypothetical protein EDD85DRAFT_790214 [Armillaria nabsnona]
MSKLLISLNHRPRHWLYMVASGWFLIYGAVSNELNTVGGIWVINKLAAMVPSKDGGAAGKGNMSGKSHDVSESIEVHELSEYTQLCPTASISVSIYPQTWMD